MIVLLYVSTYDMLNMDFHSSQHLMVVNVWCLYWCTNIALKSFNTWLVLPERVKHLCLVLGDYSILPLTTLGRV